MKKRKQRKIQKKNKKLKYYALINKNDNFLYGVFEPSKNGLEKAKEYLAKIDSTNKYYKIKKF
jgi:hypothetical protein